MLHAPASETRQQNAGPRTELRQGCVPMRVHQPLARLHNTYGNQAVLRMLSQSAAPAVQAKLTINQPGDVFEQEADRVADHVMRMPAPAPAIQRKCGSCEEQKVQRKCAECEEEEKKTGLQRKESSAGPQFAPPLVQSVLSSPGQPLDQSTRAFFEPRFGQDFSGVRVHTDRQAVESARAVNALAYTMGRNIVFGGGQYVPGNVEGKRLLAHELTHVVQQETEPVIHRKIGKITKSECSVTLGMDIGIYGPRATAALAAQWQNWINGLWQGPVPCRGNSTRSCAANVDAKVSSHPDINWWFNVPETNSAFVVAPGTRGHVNQAVDSGDWREDSDDKTIAHEVGHLMGEGDKYKDKSGKSESLPGFTNDIMANYKGDPGPTQYVPALGRILQDKNIECPCCTKL